MKNEIDKTFKRVLREFIKERLACNHMDEPIEKSETYLDLLHVLKDNSNNIGHALGYKCYECDELRGSMTELQNATNDLEEEIENLENKVENGSAKTYWDELKWKCFMENHSKFTPSKFENLMTK